MDERLREARQRWRAQPDDPTTRRAYQRALERAGQPWETAGCQEVGPYRLRAVLTGYGVETAFVSRGAISTDERWLALATEFGVRVWDLRAGRRRWAFGSPALDDPLALAFSHDGARVVGVGERGWAMWEVADGACVGSGVWEEASVPLRESTGVGFAVDGRAVSWGHVDGARWWLAPGGASERWESEVAFGTGAISADGRRWVGEDLEGGAVWVWDMETGAARGSVQAHPDVEDGAEGLEVSAVAIAPDGSEAVVAYEDTMLVRIRLDGLERVASALFEERGYPPDGLAYGAGGWVWAWQGCNARVVPVDRERLQPGQAVRLRLDATVVLRAGAERLWTTQGWVVREDALRLERWDDAHRGPVEAVGVLGEVVLSASGESPVARWRGGQRELTTQHEALTPTGSAEETLLAAMLGHRVGDLGESDAFERVAVARSASGRFMARAQLGVLQFYEDGDEVGRTREVALRELDEEALAVRDDGVVARFRGGERVLWLCDGASGEGSAWLECDPPTRIDALGFTPEGEHMLGVCDGEVVVWVLEADVHGATFDQLWGEEYRAPRERERGLEDACVAGSSALRRVVVWADGRLRGFSWERAGVGWEREVARRVRGLRVVEDRIEVVDEGGVSWLRLEDGAPVGARWEVDLSGAEDAVASLDHDGTRLVVGTEAGAVLLYERET